ncbi:MAG: glycerate kinase [Candidatus Hydrothermarchaeales archaeon]
MFGAIKNRKELIDTGVSEADKKARRLTIEILEAGLKAADPRKAVKKVLSVRDENLVVKGKAFSLHDVDRIYVVGAGKASGAMAEAVEQVLGRRITGGYVNILKGTSDMFKVSKVVLNEASHPIPDENGVRGTKKILRLVENTGNRDLVLVLISGGASALMPLPAEGLSMKDKQRATNLLLQSGAVIEEINVVRKHLSGVKGGQLARAIYPARCIGLLLSDVVGDDISTIGSGPTAPDKSTYGDAFNVLKGYDLVEGLLRIAQHLEKGMKGLIPETPKPDDESFTATENFIIGSNEATLKEMALRAGELGLKAKILDAQMTGEAKEAGRKFAEQINLWSASGGGTALLQGGETTVTVKGAGKGGRNQEFVLGALLSLREKGVAIASMGTDGVDGSSDAAGAIIDGNSQRMGRRMSLDAERYLVKNDSNTYFSLLKECIVTGPTGTNVNDIVVGVVV